MEDLEDIDISPLFQSSEEVTSPEKVEFEGTLPPWLAGSFLQIGPGLWDLSPHVRLNHLLDGYGILSIFSLSPSQDNFKPSSVSFRCHYIQSQAYQSALATSAPQFTEFGTCSQDKKSILSKLLATIGSMIKDDLSDNASASLFQFGDRVFASASTNFFYELDLTPGSFTPTGRRYDGRKILGQNGLGTHPIVDKDGTWWNMGFTVLPSLRHNILKVPPVGTVDILAQGKTLTSIPSRWKGALAVNHSFGISERFLIFVEQPLVVLVSRVLSSKLRNYSVKDWLEWRPEHKNMFHLVEKASGTRILGNYAILSEEAFFFLHILNCHEDDDKLIIDIVTSPNPASIEATYLETLRHKNLSPELGLDVKLQRFVIPFKQLGSSDFHQFPENVNLLQSGGVIHTSAAAYRVGFTLILKPETLSPSGGDQLTINPSFVGRKYSYFYGSGSFLSRFSSEEVTPFAHSVVKLDLDKRRIVGRWFQSRHHFPGEPVFIPRPRDGNKPPEEDDGVVCVAVRTLPGKGQDNFLLVLDARSWEEVGRAYFKSRIPFGIHSTFKVSGGIMTLDLGNKRV